MEPFTSAATVLQVIGMAVKTGQEIHGLVQNVRNAPKNIQRLSTELQELCKLLATFQRLLECFRDDRDSLVSEMLDNLETVLANCLGVLKDIRKAISPFVTANGDATKGKLKRLLWAALKKNDILVLQQTLGSYKAMLNLSFAALST